MTSTDTLGASYTCLRVRDDGLVADGIEGTDAPDGMSPAELSLEGRAKRLFEALSQKDPKLGAIYRGALQVLASDANPDRLALSAHGFRELMEKMPHYIGIAGTDRGQTMNAKLQDLRTAWDSACDRSDSFDAGAWQGDVIDVPLRDLLGTFAEFFESMERHALTITQSIQELLRRLDPYASDPPQDLERLRVREWKRCYVFFQNVCHHQVDPTLEDFRENVDSIEVLIHDYLVPRTFEVHQELDDLIEEAERDANS